MRRLLLLLCLTASAFGQSESFNHVHWTMAIDAPSALPGSTVLAKLTATVDPEWHMYSLTTPPGPIPTTIKTTMADAVEKVTFFEPPPVRKFDPNFHQAMFEVPDPSVPAGTVVQVVQAGYTIGDRVLRPALVGVSKGGAKQPAAANGNDPSAA